MVDIWDCRHKEKLVTKRVGGDYEMRFIDPVTGGTLFVCWFQMKDGLHYKKIDMLMEEIKCQMKRQES